jgi:antitoxin CptB
MAEDRETRIKRLKLRSMRRGIREMDMILIAFSDQALQGMTDDELARYDVLLSENDHDLYQWISGQMAAPDALAPLVARIAAMAEGLTRPG